MLIGQKISGDIYIKRFRYTSLGNGQNQHVGISGLTVSVDVRRSFFLRPGGTHLDLFPDS